MNLSALFIARPVGTWLLAAAVLMAGVLGYSLLPVAALPSVDFPSIQVVTYLPGASPDTMARLITAPLEDQLGQINGLTALISVSSQTASRITLQFDLDRKIDSAALDVQAAINAASAILPPDLPYSPTYTKVNPADTPVLTIAMQSDHVPIDRIARDANLLRLRLAQITGVGRVAIQGDMRPALRVRVDPERLAAYGLSTEDVRATLAKANADIAKGSFDGPAQAITIGANDQLLQAEPYRSLVVAYRNGAALQLGDVGSVEAGIENDSAIATYRGCPAIVLDIQRQPGSNIVQTVDRIVSALPALRRGLDPAIALTVIADRTQTIRASVTHVRNTLVLSVLLVIAVTGLFLPGWRATLIPAVTLPLSLAGTFAIMSQLGLGLDNLSLMALTVSTGFAVDDAIVMTETIVRRVEHGEPPKLAARLGSTQIGFTIVSLTASMIAVFIPLLFMTGTIGRLFRAFAITLTVAVTVSAAISLTLTPMMCAHLLHRASPGGHDGKASTFRTGFAWLEALYRRTLAWSLRHNTTMLLLGLATLVGTVWLYIAAPKGFLPQQDTGLIVAVMQGEPSASLQRMEQLQQTAEAIVRADTAVADVVRVTGAGNINPTPNTGRMTIVLQPRDRRDAPAKAIAVRLRQRLATVAGLSAFLQPVQDLQIGARMARAQYQFTLSDTDAAELAQWTPRLLQRLQETPALSDVASDQQQRGLRTDVIVDRAAAMRFGVTMQVIQDVLYDTYGQRQVATLFAPSSQSRIVLEGNGAWKADPESLTRLRVPGAPGGGGQGAIQVPLSSIARLEKTVAPLAILHDRGFPAVTISFNLGPGGSLETALTAIAATERAIGLPSSVIGRFSGDAAEFQASLAAQPWLILAAVIAIYIVLGVLYESVIHPITILSTLPSAGIGALLALRFAGLDLSVVALIGIILLMGIVKKNAIMMIDAALAMRRTQALPPEAAIAAAAVLRFRPIMMTTLAALLGSLPLMLESGAGSELRQPLGVAIVGGLLLSQLLTLYTTPALFVMFERLGWRQRRMEARTV